jgi:hypothetical protein
MPARVRFEQIAAGLTVPERVLLFCLASGTDWQKAGVTHATAQHMMIKCLVERQAAGSYVLTDEGRAVLEALLES